MALKAFGNNSKCFLPDGHLERIVVSRTLEEAVIALSSLKRAHTELVCTFGHLSTYFSPSRFSLTCKHKEKQLLTLVNPLA